MIEYILCYSTVSKKAFSTVRIAKIYEALDGEPLRAIDPKKFLEVRLHTKRVTDADYKKLVRELNNRTVNFNVLYSMYSVELWFDNR